MQKSRRVKPETEKRWRRRKHARPAEIRRAALECFGERGFAATRLEDVAERAGVTKGTVYLYFQSKEDLFKAVVKEELVPNIVRIQDRLEHEHLSPPDALAEVMRYLIETLATTRLSLFPKLVISEIGNFPELTEFYIREVIDRGFSMIGGIIREGVRSGEFREVDVEETTVCVIAPAVVSMLWRHTFEQYGGRKMDPVSLLETHIETILRGLRSETAGA